MAIMRTLTEEPRQWPDAFLRNVQTGSVAYQPSIQRMKDFFQGDKTAGAIPLLPFKPSWRGQGQPYLFLHFYVFLFLTVRLRIKF
jgi:hypothetical protein